ncbi:MAG: glycosyltransferase family 4 protein [Sphingomonadaceae bacterium]|nr:glycosyltransferase family 4 protein [Sphingomonadaceae bacterium]
MKIAMLAPISWRTPPRAYGPWELVTSLLTEALIAKGVDVTLFATLDSLTSGPLDGVVPAPYSEDPAIDAKVWEMLHIAHCFERAHAFDIIHSQADFMPLGWSRMTQTPLVTTIHGFSGPRILPAFERYQHDTHYVAISDADRAPGLRYAATIHHGIPLEDFPFDPVGSDALLFFGRIHPDKGPAHAIRAAHAVGRKLLMAGIIHDEGYHAREVQPHIDGEQVRYIGPVGGADRTHALGSAYALLHLIDFDEPFGLSVIEAMACGTPVIAVRRGSMPELIVDGVTGFLIDRPEDAPAAIARIPEIDRAACRAHVAKHFTLETMADRYIVLYERILSAR